MVFFVKRRILKGLCVNGTGKNKITKDVNMDSCNNNYYNSFLNTTALIYSTTIYRGKPLYDDYLELMDTIISKNNEKINSEISDLFS